MKRACFHHCAFCRRECPKCGADKHEIETECDLCVSYEKNGDYKENRRSIYAKHDVI